MRGCGRGLVEMTRFLHFIDALSAWVGKSFGWLILVLTLGISYEVFVRYVLRAPTTWAFDFAYITYGAMFLMAGAYALSRNNHVRADVVIGISVLSGKTGTPAGLKMLTSRNRIDMLA